MESLFHATNFLSIFSMIESHINLALNFVRKGRPEYFIGKDETLPPRLRAKLLTFGTLPTGINSDLAKLIFNLEATSKQRSTHLSYLKLSGAVPQKMTVSSAKRRWDTDTRSSLLAPTEKPEIKPSITAAAALVFLIRNYEPLTSLVLKQFQKSCGM
jgi:hypothetical protein